MRATGWRTRFSDELTELIKSVVIPLLGGWGKVLILNLSPRSGTPGWAHGLSGGIVDRADVRQQLLDA
jgi:hypothetical protein